MRDSSRTILRATACCVVRSYARNTSPIPPLPRLWRISYRSLITVPVLIGGGTLRIGWFIAGGIWRNAARSSYRDGALPGGFFWTGFGVAPLHPHTPHR